MGRSRADNTKKMPVMLDALLLLHLPSLQQNTAGRSSLARCSHPRCSQVFTGALETKEEEEEEEEEKAKMRRGGGGGGGGRREGGGETGFDQSSGLIL
jgi:hypothetical protein